MLVIEIECVSRKCTQAFHHYCAPVHGGLAQSYELQKCTLYEVPTMTPGDVIVYANTMYLGVTATDWVKANFDSQQS